MNPMRRRSLLALAAIVAAGCAGIRPEEFEPPRMMLSSFRMVPSDGVTPRFLIGLRIVNPNRTALNLRGLSYDVELEGHRFLSGVAGNLASVPAYGESEIEVQAGLDLFSGLRLFNDLINDPQRDHFKFVLRARLDLGALHPILSLEESGDLRLWPVARQ